MSLAAGTRLGPYEITLPIGAGGMGEVYRARDTRLDRTVAIKLLPPAFATGERKVLLRDADDARYVSTGHLVFMRQGVLFAVSFDPERLSLLGNEVR